MRRSLAALALIAGVLVVACSSAPAPTPQIVYVTPEPTATASPAATPTPKPAATPTPEPTPVPASSVGGTPFTVFYDHADGAMSAIGSAGQDVGSPAVIQLVDVELQWLAEHPPQKCYLVAFRIYEEMITTFQTAHQAYADGEYEVSSATFLKSGPLLDRFKALMNNPETCSG